MGKFAIAVLALFFVFSGQAMAQPVAKHLIDSKPAQAVLISLGDWFPANPLKEGKLKNDRVYESSRGTVNLLAIKDTKIGLHLHTAVDEIVYIYKGSGEMYINGKWVPVKAGDLHVCPRGVAHSTKAGSEELWVVSIFTPPMPEAGDRVTME